MKKPTEFKSDKQNNNKLVLLKFDKIKKTLKNKFVEDHWFWRLYFCIAFITFIITLVAIPYYILRHSLALNNLLPLFVCCTSLIVLGLIAKMKGVNKVLNGLTYDLTKCCIVCFILSALIFIPPIRDFTSGLYQKYIEFSKTAAISEEHSWKYVIDEKTREQIINSLDSTMFQEKTIALNNVFTGLDQIKKGLIFIHQNAEYLSKNEINRIDESVSLLEAMKSDMNNLLLGMPAFADNYKKLLKKANEQIELISSQTSLITTQKESISELKNTIKKMENNIEENAEIRYVTIMNENEILKKNLNESYDTIKTLRQEYNYSKDIKTSKIHVGSSGKKEHHNEEFNRLKNNYIPYFKNKYKNALMFIYISEEGQVRLPSDLDKFSIDVVVQYHISDIDKYTKMITEIKTGVNGIKPLSVWEDN